MTTKREGVERLAAVPMFSELSKRELGRVWDRMKLVEHREGHHVVNEGRGGYGFHVLLTGTARVSRRGARVDLGPGDFFGEMSLIDQGPRTATVTATSPLVTATLNPSEFKRLAMQHPDITWKLLVHTTERLRAEQSARANLTA